MADEVGSDDQDARAYDFASDVEAEVAELLGETDAPPAEDDTEH